MNSYFRDCERFDTHYEYRTEYHPPRQSSGIGMVYNKVWFGKPLTV